MTGIKIFDWVKNLLVFLSVPFQSSVLIAWFTEVFRRQNASHTSLLSENLKHVDELIFCYSKLSLIDYTCKLRSDSLTLLIAVVIVYSGNVSVTMYLLQ